jgi:hypothetical protein
MENNKAQAMRSYHDDLVLSLAIACWIRDSVFEINQRDIEYRKAITSSMRMTNKKFHTTIQGMTGHDSLSEKQREAKEEYKQLVWLYKG